MESLTSSTNLNTGYSGIPTYPKFVMDFPPTENFQKSAKKVYAWIQNHEILMIKKSMHGDRDNTVKITRNKMNKN